MAALGGLVTLLVSVLPFLRFAYRSPWLHGQLVTVAGLIAGLAAYLVVGRFRERRELRDLLLACALAVFAGANLFLGALPATLEGELGGAFATWSRIIAHVVAASLLAAAAFAPDRRLEHPVRLAVGAIAACALVLALIAGVVAVSASHLPVGIDPTLSPSSSHRPLLAGHPLVHATQLLAMALFASAAVGFARLAARLHEPFFTYVAAASVLSGFARLNYFLFPSLFSEWVYTGDFLRLASYLLLLIGGAREIAAYRAAAARSAVLEERRRIARDLHDGLAQELSYILSESRRLRPLEPSLEPLARAAERALDESRRAIAALTRPHEPLDVALAQAAEEVAERVGTRVELDLAAELDAPPATLEALLRVVREAVTNAGRHGLAGTVRVQLRRGDGLELLVSDDGIGFDPSRANGSGFGLVSMRERVAALGGELRVVSAPGRGTALQVFVP